MIFPFKVLMRTRPAWVQQSAIFFSLFNCRVLNANIARLAVKSSLRNTWPSLCSFKLTRARNTSSQMASLRKRTMTARVFRPDSVAALQLVCSDLTQPEVLLNHSNHNSIGVLAFLFLNAMEAEVWAPGVLLLFVSLRFQGCHFLK